jgi:predicted acyltransferase
LGLLAALWLSGKRAARTKMLGLAAGAAVCLSSGYLWSIWLPLNKKMWTSSYVLVAAGWSLLLFALVYGVVEQRGWGKSGWSRALAWPWLVFGSNAIVAYMISELLGTAIELIHFSSGGRRTDALAFVYAHVFDYIGNPGWRAFAYSVSYTAVCFLPVWVLYRRKIFVKV